MAHPFGSFCEHSSWIGERRKFNNIKSTKVKLNSCFFIKLILDPEGIKRNKFQKGLVTNLVINFHVSKKFNIKVRRMFTSHWNGRMYCSSEAHLNEASVYLPSHDLNKDKKTAAFLRSSCVIEVYCQKPEQKAYD